MDMAGKVADIKSTEINLIPLGLVADSARSMPDLSRSESLTLPKDSFPSYMPGASEPKKKRGFLSFLKRKDNKFKVQETRYDMDTPPASSQMTLAQARQSTAPATSQQASSADIAQVRPKSMFVTAKELQAHEESSKESTLPRAPPKKKRPAPPPPQLQKTIPETVEISVKDKTTTVQVQEKKTETIAKSTPDHVTQRLHSRNSSDSSGYHELTLSGAESPEASRVSTNFKTSIDTTSIESADNTNGDSGINEHSPVHSSPKHRDMSAGDSKTLPLPRGNKKAVQRSHSLEKKEKANKAPPPSTKKRRAPAPPPGADSEDEIDGQIDNVVLNDPDTDDDSIDINETLDGLMMMVEDASIASEDIGNIEQPKAVRPCSFVAPPPPSEPPPPQTPEADTVDVAVEVHDNASLGLSSVKNSPVAESGYKTEMAMFVERMSKLTEKAGSETNISDTTSISLPDTESTSETGSVIRHETDGRPHHAKMDSYSSDSGSVQKFESEDRSRGGSSDASGGLSSSYDDTHVPERLLQRIRRDSLELHRENSTADNEVSEIDVPVETLLPPPEFRNEPEDKHEEEEEEEEEEYRESVEEIIITMPASSSYTFGGAYKIPDYETPKEHSGLPDSPRSRTVDPSLVYSTFEINDKPSPEPERAQRVIEKPKPPRVKEEFVLTKEDLAKIKYIDDNKWKQSYVQPAKRPASLNTSHLTHVYQSSHDPVLSYTTHQAENSQDDTEGNSLSSEHEDNVRSRCSELSFRPDSEGEIDNVLEEKSISMIALPAMRTSVLKKSDDDNLDNRKQDSDKMPTAGVPNTMSDADREIRSQFFDDDTDEIVQAKPVYITENTVDSVEKVETSVADDEDLRKQQEALHAQYDILQQQFSMWQQQLEQNQKLLASQHIDPEVQNIQQMQAKQMQVQMEMQQQMMAQLQKSMDALSLQQKSKADAAAVNAASASVIAESTRPSGGSLSMPASASVSTPPPPPPSPPIPATQVLKTAVKGDKQGRKNDPRFERKLDPREELMIAIRTFGERAGLKKVPIQKTHWHMGSS